ncbi:IPT/TIG domain-containing protein [Mucilaginibacter sp. RCC_168]|uniref:IPT/TIG domain-containing protein n=1 Tax=Mucilaginibacter sp. RCC_168 TaxID=3239221 RepID=UPI003524F050
MKLAYYFSFCIIILLATLLSNCKKDHATIPPDNPKIVTNTVTVYPDGGVTLNGQINEVPGGITEYGFLLSGDSLFTYPQRFKVAAPAVKGAFKIDIPTGLQKNTKYFVATYATSSTTGYSRYNVVYFNSSGSKKPMVSSVLPLKADLGDTIIIKGKYFSGQYLNIAFGDISTSIISINDTILKCLVPINLSQATSSIALKYNGTADIITTGFSLNTPVITNFTSLATFRDSLIITGDHFGYQNSLNQVNIGTAMATVVSSTRKRLKVMVPDNVPHSFNNITIKAQAQTITSATQFQIREPVITAVTPSAVNVNDQVTIKGQYFHPLVSSNVVYSESNLTELKNGNTTQLTYDMPNGPYPRRKAKVTLKMLDYTVTSTVDIAVKDRWIIVGKIPFNDYAVPGAFTINNSSYVIASTLAFSDGQLYLWKFNTADYSWQQISIPFKVTNAMVTATGSKAYMYILSSTHNFYEFDPSSNTWTQKADYPVSCKIRRYHVCYKQ